MIGHRPISTSQHHPGAQRRQLRTGAIEAEQGQRGHGGRKPGKGMNLATSPQNECENRRRRPSRGLAHTPGTPIFALFRWTSERAASIRGPDGGSGQGSFASRKGTVVLLDGAEMIGHLLWNRASLPLIASRLGIECIESTAPVRVQPIPKRLDGHTSSSGPRDLVDPLCFVTQQSIKTPLTHFPVHEVSDEAVAKQRDLLACLLIHDCWLLSARLASGREESTARCYGGSAPVLCWSRSSLFDVRIPAGRNPSGRGKTWRCGAPISRNATKARSDARMLRTSTNRAFVPRRSGNSVSRISRLSRTPCRRRRTQRTAPCLNASVSWPACVGERH